MPERFFLPFMDALHQLFERTLRMDFNAERAHACKHASIFLRSWSFLLWNGSPNISLFCPEALVQQTAGNAGR